MKNFCALTFFCLSFVALGTAKRQVPNYIHICKRSDPHVAKCIRESVEVLRPRLRSGIPDLDVPPLEPLIIDEIVLLRGEPPTRFTASLKNVKVIGASYFQITKLKANVDKNTYRVGVKFPKLDFEGIYDVDAKVFGMPIKGTGNMQANITDVDGQGVLKAEVFERNGHKEIKFTSFDFAIKISDYSLHLDNLFNGDEVLSKAVNDILNENKQDLIEAALPFIQNKAAEVLLNAANKITEDLDYDEVFPEK